MTTAGWKRHGAKTEKHYKREESKRMAKSKRMLKAREKRDHWTSERDRQAMRREGDG